MDNCWLAGWLAASMAWVLRVNNPAPIKKWPIGLLNIVECPYYAVYVFHWHKFYWYFNRSDVIIGPIR